MSKQSFSSSKLATDSLKGGIFFMTTLTGAIFLPAWTINYWQAYVYLFIFGFSCLLITTDLLKNDTKLLQSRMDVGAKAEVEKSQQVIQAFSSIFVFAIIVSSGFDHRFGWSNVETLYVLIADLAVALGFLIIFRVFKENTYTAATIKVDKKQKVIASGPYSLVRHPMYFGALLIFFGTPIALGSYWATIFAVTLTITLIWRLLEEEKYLSKNLPGYKEYCHHTKKHLIPFIW